MYAGKYASPHFKPLTIAATLVVTSQPTRPGSLRNDLKSLTTSGASTCPRPRHQYTGSAMLGIGTMHKSNAVPVFSRDDAKAIATMRTGG
jgi:hypothetical protein